MVMVLSSPQRLGTIGEAVAVAVEHHRELTGGEQLRAVGRAAHQPGLVGREALEQAPARVAAKPVVQPQPGRAVNDQHAVAERDAMRGERRGRRNKR